MRVSVDSSAGTLDGRAGYPEGETASQTGDHNREDHV